MNHEKQNQQNIARDPLIRREAGEGWHENGLDEELLEALVSREVLVDKIVDTNEYGQDSEVWHKYRDSLEGVAGMKDERGITEPPSRKPEDISGESH